MQQYFKDIKYFNALNEKNINLEFYNQTNCNLNTKAYEEIVAKGLSHKTCLKNTVGRSTKKGIHWSLEEIWSFIKCLVSLQYSKHMHMPV